MVQDMGRLRPGLVRARKRAWLGLAVLAAAALGGCQTDANLADASAAKNSSTLAFESIDGAPRPVFDRLVADIDAQAKARRVAIVSREGAAQYRVRAYLAATVNKRQTAINWVWDVYDSDGHRLTRLAGEVPAGSSAADAWADADDRVLGHIAEAGMSQLAAFTAEGGTAVPVVAAAPAETVLASAPAEPDVQVVAAADTTASIAALH